MKNKPSANDCDSDLDTQEYFAIHKTPEITHTIIIRIDSGIADATKYTQVYQTLDEASSRDIVILQLNSPGGDCHTLIRLANALKMCKAHVNVHVIGVCESAAAMLALCGNSLYVFPNTLLMYHNYTSVDAGKGQELSDSVDRTKRWLREFFEQNCSPFLTRKELNKIARDGDVTIHASDKDLQERINRHFKRKLR